MRHRNRHTATLGLPGGEHVAPGAEADLDANARENIAVKAWITAGMLEPLEAEEPAPPVAPTNPERPERKPGRR